MLTHTLHGMLLFTLTHTLHGMLRFTLTHTLHGKLLFARRLACNHHAHPVRAWPRARISSFLAHEAGQAYPQASSLTSKAF